MRGVFAARYVDELSFFLDIMECAVNLSVC